MIKASIEPSVLKAAPTYAAVLLCCQVTNTGFDAGLWKELDDELDLFRRRYVVADVNKLPGIYHMRQLYKKLGKDPNRYRPSAESLCRRVLKEKELYQINTLVDMINLISIHTGFSIGGFDADKIVGDIQLGVGMETEPYQGIGRGFLNIEGLPVWRDELGGIGTPTSDEERTKIDLETSRLLMIINSADGSQGLEEALALTLRLLSQYVQAKDIKHIQMG